MHQIPLTWNEALSGISGSISLASWIFLLIPQLVENYQQRSAQGISLTFILIWFLGDVANLVGALWAGLVPTVVAIAVYFCFSDAILILQCSYYNALNRRASVVSAAAAAPPKPDPRSPSFSDTIHPPSEQSPLLRSHPSPAAAAAGPQTKPPSLRRVTDITDENLGLPGSRRRRGSAASSLASARRRSDDPRRDSLARIPEESRGGGGAARSFPAWARNALAILVIVGVGTGGWALAWKVGAWRPTPVVAENGGDRESFGVRVDRKMAGGSPIGAGVLGYASALLYLGARIPQIVKNQREKSCDGLSLLFFLLSLMGNATYGAGILFHSLRREYVLTNLPWLIGSLGTMVEDAIIFVQFSVFGEREEPAVVDEV